MAGDAKSNDGTGEVEREECHSEYRHGQFLAKKRTALIQAASASKG